MDLARTFRTVRHLRASQIWHRVRLTTRRKLWSRAPGRIDARYTARATSAPPLPWDHAGLAHVARLRAEHRDPARALAIAEDALRGRFTLLGEARDLAVPDGAARVDWDRPDLMQALLWKTHLHEWAWSLDLALAHRATGDARFRDGFFALARDWHAAEPIGRPGFARVAWNERVVATRLMHWSVAGSLFGLQSDAADATWLGREIARHALFLRDNLALDLLANHLFRDCVALVFAHALLGVVPDADRLLEREVREQIGADGAHVERCPMYHAVCVADLVDLVALLGETAPAWLADALARAAGFLDGILLGDGDIPLLGDGWRGEVDVTRVLAHARALAAPRVPESAAGASGVVRLERGGVRCVVRAGPHGPDHQLGHAHADLLSFDASFGPHRIVTDTGTAAYADGPVRRHLRSTAAHNTLELDGAELLEAWSSFRSGRRGRAQVRARGGDARATWLVATHDGYAWLPGAPRPQRLWVVTADVLWVIDAVTGDGEHRIASRLHLHPDAPADRFDVVALGDAPLRREPAPLHERFGETRAMARLVCEIATDLPWAGGFALRFGARIGAPLPSFAFDGAVARVRAADLAITWDVAAAAVSVESLS